MAFTRATFSLVQGHASGTGQLRQRFQYETEDTIANCLTDGYFDLVGSALNDADATGEIKTGDIIEVFADNSEAIGSKAYGLMIVDDPGTASTDTSTVALIASTAY
jgi:hypothetical protein